MFIILDKILCGPGWLSRGDGLAHNEALNACLIMTTIVVVAVVVVEKQQTISAGMR